MRLDNRNGAVTTFWRCCWLLALTVTGRSASAHEGPPFPLLVDQPLAGNLVSVWTDPDVGEATFYLIVESPSPGALHREPAASMWVQPASERLPRADYAGALQNVNGRTQIEFKPHFDACDTWRVGFRLAMGQENAEELVAEVESTPPGLGTWDLAIYAFPFSLLGGMWAIALVRRRLAFRSIGSTQPPRETSPSHPSALRSVAAGTVEQT